MVNEDDCSKVKALNCHFDHISLLRVDGAAKLVLLTISCPLEQQKERQKGRPEIDSRRDDP